MFSDKNIEFLFSILECTALRHKDSPFNPNRTPYRSWIREITYRNSLDLPPHI